MKVVPVTVYRGDCWGEPHKRVRTFWNMDEAQAYIRRNSMDRYGNTHDENASWLYAQVDLHQEKKRTRRRVHEEKPTPYEEWFATDAVEYGVSVDIYVQHREAIEAEIGEFATFPGRDEIDGDWAWRGVPEDNMQLVNIDKLGRVWVCPDATKAVFVLEKEDDMILVRHHILGGNLFVSTADEQGTYDEEASVQKYISLCEAAIKKEYPEVKVEMTYELNASGGECHLSVEKETDEDCYRYRPGETGTGGLIATRIWEIVNEVYESWKWIVYA